MTQLETQMLDALKGAVRDINTLMGRLEDESRDTGDFEIDKADYVSVIQTATKGLTHDS